MDRPPTLPVAAARSASRGVSLPELLVVIAILALGVMVSIPMIVQPHRYFARETIYARSIGIPD